MKLKIKIAVISDIHANADALITVLDDLKGKSIDLTIVLGDILTYGCQPKEVISILSEYQMENPVKFIKGNHDQFYFDLQSSFKKSSYKLKKYVEESVSWTLKKISPLLLKDVFEWHDNYQIGNVYFSHANPFLYGDWSYVEKLQDQRRSFEELTTKNIFSGVFAHSHRQLFIGSKKNSLYEIDSYCSTDNHLDKLIINTGSIGQPRGKGLGYVILEIENNELLRASFKKIDINLDNSIELIRQTELSQETKRKLIHYLEI